MRLQSCRLGYRLVKLQESIFILPYLPRYVSMFPSSRCSHPHLCIPNQAMGNNNKLSKAKRPLSPSYVLPKPSSIQPLPSQTKLFPTPSINQSIQRLSKSKVQNSFKSARHLASHHTQGKSRAHTPMPSPVSFPSFANTRIHQGSNLRIMFPAIPHPT